jgi:hypothetical protein
MQDVQNIPNPDVNSTEHDDDFGSHSDFPNTDVEQSNDLPVPPDTERAVPVEEPPETDRPAIEEDDSGPKKLV